MKSCNLKRLDLWLDVATEDEGGEVVPVDVSNICFYVGEFTICRDGLRMKDSKTLAEYLTRNHLASLHGAA